MGVRTTDNTNVALYDSVTGHAFGEVFATEQEAEDFLEWLDSNEGRDARVIPSTELGQLRSAWERQRDDDKSDVELYGAGSR